MRVLLDTHFLVWLIEDETRISPAERALLGRNSTQSHVSSVSIWELRMKGASERRRGRPVFVPTPEIAIRFCNTNNITFVDMRADDPAIVLATEPAHHDPFDEMLLIHAQRLGARLLSRDRLLRDHPLVLQL